MNKILITKERFTFLAYSKSYFGITDEYDVLSESPILTNIEFTLAINLKLRKEYIGNV